MHFGSSAHWLPLLWNSHWKPQASACKCTVCLFVCALAFHNFVVQQTEPALGSGRREWIAGRKWRSHRCSPETPFSFWIVLLKHVLLNITWYLFLFVFFSYIYLFHICLINNLGGHLFIWLPLALPLPILPACNAECHFSVGANFQFCTSCFLAILFNRRLLEIKIWAPHSLPVNVQLMHNSLSLSFDKDTKLRNPDIKLKEDIVFDNPKLPSQHSPHPNHFHQALNRVTKCLRCADRSVLKYWKIEVKSNGEQAVFPRLGRVFGKL